ncbi:hypothetical protein G7Y79_00009g027240 [Physcia stellaris]|nr:hypothetical protein G7Y79_00009g027240 [Physcia stellaris]
MSFSHRGTPKGGVKDPSSGRAATTGKAASLAKSKLKARPSLSSITNRNVEPEDTADERSNPAVDATSKKASIASSKRSTSPTKASIGRRSTMGSKSNVEKRPIADQSSIASPSTVSAKPSTHNARPPTTATHRSTRPIHYSPQSVGKSALAKKRLSSISASPTPPEENSPSSAAIQPSNQVMTKAARPALGARKSTMSVTIEQRWRELALVGTMLRAAMDDDGTPDNATKEEYGDQADKDLAMLRAKLEEARRNEGKEPLDTTGEEALPESVKEALPVVNIDELETKLTASEEKVTRLQAELIVVRKELEKKLDEAAACHQKEIEVARSEAKEADARKQEAVLRVEHLAYEKLDLKNSIDDAQAKHAQLLQESLESEDRHRHEHAIEEARHRQWRDMAIEAEWAIIMISSLPTSRCSVVYWPSDLAEDTNADFLNRGQAKELKVQLASAVDRYKTSQEELRNCQLLVKKLESAAEERLSHFVQATDSYMDKINELQIQIEQSSASRKLLADSRDEQNTQLQRVIESLQDRVQDVYEAKETELERQRLHLTQEHDESISKLRAANERLLQSERESGHMQLEKLKKSRDQAMSELQNSRGNHEEIIDNYEYRLEEAERLLESSNMERSEAVSKLQAAVAENEEKISIIMAKDRELDTLYQQRNAETANVVTVKDDEESTELHADHADATKNQSREETIFSEEVIEMADVNEAADDKRIISAVAYIKHPEELGDDEDLGPALMGNLAAIQERLRAMDSANENQIAEQKRLIQRMSSLYKPEPLRWLDANISEETEEKLEQH